MRGGLRLHFRFSIRRYGLDLPVGEANAALCGYLASF